MTMVGKGPLSALVQEEIRRRRLEHKVKLLPEVTARRVEELLSETAIFVLPSRSEGLSLALLEAMAAGKLIIASRNESHQAVLSDGENALLFQTDNEKELSSQIVSALDNDQLRAKLPQLARQLCLRKFSHIMVAPQLEEVYVASLRKSNS